MTDTLWLKPSTENGPLALIVDEQGRLILCDECPCRDEDCVTAVDDKVAEMLADVVPGTQTPQWDLQATVTSDFVCAVWEQDEETGVWSLVSRASGSLLVALTYGATVSDTAEGSATLLTYAKTLVNTQTLEKAVVGCRCRVSQYDCSPRVITLRDSAIAGTLPVWEPSAGDTYLPADSCRVDACELLKLKLRTAQLWHGGTLMGEGYYDWLLTPAYWDAANYRYQPFLMAVRWSTSGSTDNVTYLDCDCTYITTHALGATETCLEYAGICTMQDPCMAMMLLHNRAVANGWTWHGEGALVHLAQLTVNGTTVYGDWYALKDQVWDQYNGYGEYTAYSRAMCCAETSDGYWVIGCGCTGLEFISKNTPVAGYRLYLDMPGICSCAYSGGNVPDRELLLTYPDEFGVDDIVWGNDNKFNYAYTSTWYDMDAGQTVTSSYSGCGVCGYTYEPVEGTGGRTMYIDYRAMCFTGKAFDEHGNVKTWVRVIYPDGSPGAPWRSNARMYFAWPSLDYLGGGGNTDIYDTAAFTGTQWTPFTNDQDIGYTVTYSNGQAPYSRYGLNFTGMHYTWSHWNGDMSMHVNGCQPTEVCDQNLTDPNEARYLAGCDDSVPTPCIEVDTTSSHLHLAAAVLTPDFSVVDHPCSIREVVVTVDEPDGGSWSYSYYCYTPRWITIGADAGTYPSSYGTVCAWLMLHICYVCTNEGFIIKGLNGYNETYTLPGASNYQQYTGCWRTPKDEQPYWDDTMITCAADTDMHFCIPEFDVPVEEEAS